MPNKPSHATVIEKCLQRLHALASYARPTETIAINGTLHVAEDVTAIYQSCLDARAELARRRTAVQESLALCAKTEAARLEADRGLKAWAVHRFGVTSKEAREFGFPPPREAVRTVVEKSLAVLRARATREARHTMGARQKETVRGVLPAEGAAPGDA